MPRPSKYPPEFRERSVRIARESERPISAVARDLRHPPETLRVWVARTRPTTLSVPIGWPPPSARSSPHFAVQVRDLRRSNEILKAASVFVARELDQPRPR